MKPASRRWLLGFLSALALSSTLAEEMAARVVNVVDGDTITVTDQNHQVHKIRIEGIDAPEKGQAYGRVSRQHLAGLLFERNVHVEYKKRDRYGRLVGRVTLQQQDIGLRQIEAGLAWHYKAYAKEQSPQDRERYDRAEAQARAEQLGLWAEKEAQAPWDYRRRSQVNPAAAMPPASRGLPP